MEFMPTVFEHIQFHYLTLEGEKWIENCRGTILVEYGDEVQWPKQHVPLGILPLTRDIVVDKAYELFDFMGLGFGPNFRSLAHIAFGSDDRAYSEVGVFSSVHEETRTRDYIIHPITLDGIFQTILLALTQTSSSRLPTTVPTKVHNLWIKGTGDAYPIITPLQVTARVEQQSARNTRSTASAYDENGNLLVHMDFLETVFVDSVADLRQDLAANDTCFNITWKPDINLIRNDTAALQTTPGIEYSGDHFEDLSILFSHICTHGPWSFRSCQCRSRKSLLASLCPLDGTICGTEWIGSYSEFETTSDSDRSTHHHGIW